MSIHSYALAAAQFLVITIFSLQPLTEQASAQELSAVEQARIQQIFKESMTSRSSHNGVSGIPKHELYMTVFAEILIAPEDAYGFTSEDWEIIASLPSHSDRRFRAVTDNLMGNFCNFVKTETRANVAAAIEVAGYYERAKSATDSLLSDHYDDVIASLSDRGREALRRRVENMDDRMEIVHTDIDIANLARSAPAYAIRMLKSGCERTISVRDSNPAQTLLLSEELVRNLTIASPEEVETRSGR